MKRFTLTTTRSVFALEGSAPKTKMYGCQQTAVQQQIRNLSLDDYVRQWMPMEKKPKKQARRKIVSFNLDVLKIDPLSEVEKLSQFVVNQVSVVFRRKGIIVGLSGGIDSACMASVALHATGKERVFGLVLPEKESNPISRDYAIKHAQTLAIEFREIDISPTVDSVVSDSWRDKFLQKLIPEYEPGYKYNITLPKTTQLLICEQRLVGWSSSIIHTSAM